MAERISVYAANALLDGLKDAFAGCFINIYEGTQPTTPETAASGTLLGTVTLDGDGSTGLTWDTPASGDMEKPSAAVWSGEWVASGTAGWCRVYEAADTTPGAASTTKVRFDMVCTRTGSTECILSTLTAVSGGTFSINSATITMPVA